MVKKICATCTLEFPLSAFRKDKSRPQGVKPHCLDCSRAKERDVDRKRYAANTKWRQVMRSRKQKRSRKLIKAKTKVRTAVINGRIIKPSACSDCGSTQRIQAHHDDYRKPLDVRWLCQPCHMYLHRKPSILTKYFVLPPREALAAMDKEE